MRVIAVYFLFMLLQLINYLKFKFHEQKQLDSLFRKFVMQKFEQDMIFMNLDQGVILHHMDG